ncbi:DUF2523 family protein [Acinetobacter schindleri]|uniref:DUF2523 family protein n=1 Tax=Acinetobacter schindleri TaxID=108981 RepID=UPI0015D10A65
MKVLALLLTTLISSIIARVLLGAGLTFITYEWVSDVLDDLISQAQRSMNQLPEFALSMAKLWELDLCFSMLLSTVQVIIFVKVARLFIGKTS